MITYAINLKDSAERRLKLKSMLEQYQSTFELHFVEAVDCRNMSSEQLDNIFCQEKAFEIYGRNLVGGEVGCLFSHRKCCEEFLKSGENVALVVEDDMVLRGEDISGSIVRIEEYVKSVDFPVCFLLSGDYWFTTRRTFGNGLVVANVREAVCAHAYILNRSAARLILDTDPCYLADDFYHLSQSGIKLRAIYPHIADQNRKDWKTEISDSYTGTLRRNLSIPRMLHSYYRAVIKRALKYTGRFESKLFLE